MQLSRSIGSKALRWLGNQKRRRKVRRVATGIAVAVVGFSVVGVPLQLAYAQLGSEPVPETTAITQFSDTIPSDLPTIPLATKPPETPPVAATSPTQTPTDTATSTAPAPSADTTTTPASQPTVAPAPPAQTKAASSPAPAPKSTAAKPKPATKSTAAKPAPAKSTAAKPAPAKSTAKPAPAPAAPTKAAPPPVKTIAAPPPAKPAPAPAKKTATTPAVSSSHLVIPALGVNAPFQSAPVTNGALVIPDNPSVLSRYSKGATPCATKGTVLLAGHVSNNGKKGALYNLKSLGAGSIAYLGCGNGQVSTWKMTSSYVANQDALTWDLFTSGGPNRLAVVTCTGPLGSDGQYHQNLIVLFSRVS
jgi:hypothetical protein